MIVVRVDSKGRIVIPKQLREKLGIKEGDMVVLQLENSRLIVRKTHDPFKRLEELLGELTFDRRIRIIAEREAIKDVKGSG